jgi:hypothetical protein
LIYSRKDHRPEGFNVKQLAFHAFIAMFVMTVVHYGFPTVLPEVLLGALVFIIMRLETLIEVASRVRSNPPEVKTGLFGEYLGVTN